MAKGAQIKVLDAAADQIIDGVMTEVAQDTARAEAERILAMRLEFFRAGLIQIGFAPSVDRDPGGRIVLTIDPDAWTAPIPGPLDPIHIAEDPE